MKIKLTLMAVAATIALGYQARASIGTVTNYSKLNFSATVTTNGPESTSGDVSKAGVKTAKFTNKDLLKLTAAWYDVENTNEVGTTTWPDGAQLVIGWDSEWDGDVLVVDKTGTNVLYDAIGDDSSHYFYVDYYDEDGAYTYTDNENEPGSYTLTEMNEGYWQLYDDEFFLPYTDLWGDGSSKQKTFENWDADGNNKTWSISGQIKTPAEGDQYLLDFGYESTTSGSANASGHGKGYNSWCD